MPTSNLLCSASSRRCDELARRLGRLHRSDGVPHLDGGVRHVGGDLQLDLPDLRFDLAQLHARARDARRPARSAERIGHVDCRPSSADTAVREQRRERVARCRPEWCSVIWLPSDAVVRALQLRAADALHAVVHLQVDDRQRLVAQEAQRGVVVLEVLLGDLEVGALAERAPNRRFDVDRLGLEVGPIDRVERGRPVRIFGAATRSAA